MALHTPQTKVLSPADGLEKVLAEQLTLYTQYYEHLKGDQECMAKLRIHDLEKSNKAKSTILLKIQGMDQAREAYVQQLKEQFQISTQPIKLADICKFVPADQARRLTSTQEDLLKIFQSIRALGEETQSLANHSLTWINGSIASLKTMMTPNSTYSPTGRVDHPKMFSGRTVEKRA